MIVHPLIQLATYAVVFQLIFRAGFRELDNHTYITFVALALWPWLIFADGLQRGTQAIRSNAALIRKVAFPHELLVIAAVAAAFFIHLSGYALVIVILTTFDSSLSLGSVGYSFLILLLLFAFTIALSLVIGAVQVFAPDVEQILGPVIGVLFYATPVIYPISAVPDWLKTPMAMNPLVHFIEPIRRMIMEPAFHIPLGTTLFLIFVPLLLVPALWVFRRLSPFFEDYL
jgi:ABC-type polysaccharide/polyol phosphate export permease